MLLKKPLLVYDGECALCIYWVKRWRNVIGNKIDYAPLQRVARHFPKVPERRFHESVILIEPGGQTFSGARAVFESLAFGGRRYWLWLYKNLSGFALTSEAAYTTISRNRPFFYHLTIFFIEIFPYWLLIIVAILTVMAVLKVF